MSYLIIDTDGASDDLIAILLGLRNKEGMRISAITLVAGAVEVEQAEANVGSLLGLADADIPLIRGAAKPLIRPLENAAAIRAHGPSGVAGVELPSGSGNSLPGPAAQSIIEAARDHPHKVTVVCIGPVTNLALALRLDSSLASLLENIIVSSGTVTAPGNVVPAADFNFWIDPEAAAIVLSSGARITMVPWDRYVDSAVLSEAGISSTRAAASKVGQLLLDANEGIAEITGSITPHDSGLVIGDTLAVAISQKPELALVTKPFHVAVETASQLTRGVSVVDVYGVTNNETNVDVVLEIDRQAFLPLLIGALT